MAGAGTFGLDPDDLRALMGKRKEGMVAALKDKGGTAGLMEKLKTCPEGLTRDENDLKRRREVFGQNWILAAKSRSFLRLLWDAFLDPLLIILAIFALVGLSMSVYNEIIEEEGDEESFEWIEPVSLQVQCFFFFLHFLNRLLLLWRCCLSWWSLRSTTGRRKSSLEGCRR